MHAAAGVKMHRPHKEVQRYSPDGVAAWEVLLQLSIQRLQVGVLPLAEGLRAGRDQLQGLLQTLVVLLVVGRPVQQLPACPGTC